MKKTVKMIIGALAAAAAVSVFTGTAFADITDQEAEQAVLEAASFSADKAVLKKSVLDFENGKWMYDVEYIVPGEGEFDFKVDPVTGDILTTETDLWEAEDEFDYKNLLAAPAEPARAEVLDEMFDKCLEHAGLTREQVLLTKSGTDFDDGRQIVDIEFIVPGTTVYDYDVALATGDIVGSETDPWEAEDEMEYMALISPEAAAAEPAPAGETDEEKAKMIALTDAEVKESDVSFVRVERGMENGIPVFEIEFRTASGLECDYDISIADGSIVSRDIEMDD